jgi:hypothetical protein
MEHDRGARSAACTCEAFVYEIVAILPVLPLYRRLSRSRRLLGYLFPLY